MISIKFLKNSEKIVGFKISGHSGYAESGSDIICAAVSSAVEMAANTITEIQKINAKVKTDDGYLEFLLSEESEQAQTVLKGLELHLKSLSEEYPKYIVINYGGTKNA